MDELQRRFVPITEEGVAALRSRIGKKIEESVEPWCHEATRDAIRHYAHGIGDDNPLWCDPTYAAKTRWGGIIAPPSFLFACDRIVSGYVGGLPGVHAMFGGVDFAWHLPVRRGDEVTSEAQLKDLVPHETRFSGLAIQQIYRVVFSNQRGEIVAEADSWCFRTDRDLARERGTKYAEMKGRSRKLYREEEIREIGRRYEEEEIRGAVPRFWEDVAVEDRLGPMAKGPMTITGIIAYAQGWGGLYIRANKLAWKLYREHPALAIRNEHGIPDCPERVHWEAEFARLVGAPGAYDYGPERCSWMSHLATNWMGDDGFLRRLRVEIRRHNVEGETLLLSGAVTGKLVEEGRPLVELALRAETLEGELSASATARVELPAHGTTAMIR